MTISPPPIETHEASSAVESSDNTKEKDGNKFKCQQCAAQLTFTPGTHSLTCTYCHYENKIPNTAEDITELDFHEYLQQADDEQQDTEERMVIDCTSCGAQSTSEPNLTTQSCPFCGTTITSEASSVNVIKPRSLLPFKIEQQAAQESYKSWIKGLWFAPSKLKKMSNQNTPLSGVYLPHWTYDCDTVSFYQGERGDNYQERVTKTRKDADGNDESYTETVTKTRWTTVYGTVFDDFDDVLVVASKSLPIEYAQELQPWDLENLVPYDEAYLGGFKAESYQIDLEDSFEHAKGIMDGKITQLVERKIGGDEQRVSTLKTQHSNITFKHILLPVWLSAYRYNNKTYRFMVNARTGEVQGERPWSATKIGIACVAGLSIIAAGAWFFLNK